MMNRLGKLRDFLTPEKGLIQTSIGNVGSAIIGGVFWLAIASVMLVEDYGKVNYYLSLFSILSSISLLGLHHTVTTFLAKGNLDIKYQANLLVLLSNMAILPVLFLLTNNIPSLLALVGLSFFTMSWAEILASRDYRKFSTVMLAQRALQVLLSITLFIVMGVDGIILGYGTSALIFAYRFFRSFGTLKFSFSQLKEKKSFIVHSYSSAVSNSITNFADKLLVAPLFGFGVLGLYQISFQFFMFLSVIPLTIFNFLLPRESSSLASTKATTTAVVAAICFSVIFYFAIPSIIKYFFPHFIESIISAQIMTFAVIPMTISSVMTSKLLGGENTRPVFVGAVVYISSLSVLLFILGHELGLIGLSIAVLSSITTRCAFLYGYYAHVKRQKK